MDGWMLLLLAGSWMSLLAAQPAPSNSLFYQCNDTGIGVAVKSDPLGTGVLLLPQYLLLGQCRFSAITDLMDYIVFEYLLTNCGISQQVSGNVVEYSTSLVYRPPAIPGRYTAPFSERITCTSKRQATPVNPGVSQVSGTGVLQTEASLMNEAFTGPAQNRTFLLGSNINLEFAVQMAFHQPMQVYIDECTAGPSPDLETAAVKYSVIRNHGCLVDGKKVDSRFVGRPSPSRIRLTIQAFRFAAASSDVYLHCKLSVWGPNMPSDPTRKACSFYRDTGRWELLDDPSSSSICSCCDSTCPLGSRRSRRDLEGSEAPLVHTVRIGPLCVQKPDQRTGSYEWDANRSLTVQMPKEEHGVRLPPAVGALLIEVAVVVLLSLGVYLYNQRAKTRAGLSAPVENDTARLLLNGDQNHE